MKSDPVIRSGILEAVLFDMDGVLIHSPLDLAAIKQELFGDSAVFIIEGLEALPPDQRMVKDAILLQRELEAAAEAELDPVVPDLFAWLENHGIKRGVITRNSRDVVRAIAERLHIDFGAIVGREDAPPKPDPASVLTACRALGCDPKASVMVGDYIFDIEAGASAGCRTVFLETDTFRHLKPYADERICALRELQSILENWHCGSRQD
jgi:HAD superfamily hydrolase (TIGR01549 family)